MTATAVTPHEHRSAPARVALRAVAALLAGALWPVWAGDGGDGLPELRRIMRDLDVATRGVADGVAREDWTQVAEIASRIADHPQPPLAEKLHILALVGRDSARFRGYDGQIREAARSLQEAAKRKEGQAATRALADMRGACDACHATFRRPIQERYPERR